MSPRPFAHRPAASASHTALFARLILCFLAVGTAACSKPVPLVSLPEQPPAAVVFENTGVLNVATGRIAPAQDIVVREGRIAAIGATGTVEVPNGAARIDGRGATLLPGLVDSHGHVGHESAPPWSGAFPDADRNLQAYLYCGVTTVLDPADMEPDAFDRRDQINAGTLLGPTIFATGPMLTAVGGHPIPVIDQLAPWWIGWYVKRHAARPLGNDEDVRSAISGLVASRADFVKMAIDSIPDEAPRLNEQLAADVVRTAHENNLRVVAHVGTLADALQAGNAGVDAFEHMVYKEPLDQAGAAKIAAFGKPVVPTMGVFESYVLFGQGPRVPTLLETETVDPKILTAFDEIPEGAITPIFRDYFELLHANRQGWRESIRLMRAEGVILLTGSDAQSGVFPGAGLHREFALLAESGLLPIEVIRGATVEAARFIENTDDPTFGIVATGKRADLLLVDGDPTAHVANLSRIRTVMKNGVPLLRHPVVARGH